MEWAKNSKKHETQHELDECARHFVSSLNKSISLTVKTNFHQENKTVNNNIS